MSQELLSSLKRYCETGTAEGESFLTDAFITPEIYQSVICPPSGSPNLLAGKKGSGKTALLKIIQHHCEKAGVPILLIRPDDLELNDIASANDTASLKKNFYASLVSGIASHIGSRLEKLVYGTNIDLIREAERAGQRRPDAIQKILKTLAPLGSVASGIDFGKFVPEVPQQPTALLVDSVRMNLEKRKHPFFFLLLDDTDQVADPTDENQLNRIWAFFLAIRRLTTELPNFRAIVSLRSEIWGRLSSQESGQRDQVDHFRTVLIRINPTDSDLKRIIERRLDLAKKSCRLGTASLPYHDFFCGTNVRLPSSVETRSWPDFLIKSARERPRDAIQFMKSLAMQAMNNGQEKIDSETVASAMPVYSQERVDDLKLEFGPDCPQIVDVIEAFTGFEFESSTEEIASFLQKLPASVNLRVRGRTIHQGDRKDMFVLWGLLYEAGFLNPRMPDDRMAKGFRHILFLDEPHFVSGSRWNEMQKVTWEIHPAYRSFLITKETDEEARKRVKRSKDKRKRA